MTKTPLSRTVTSVLKTSISRNVKDKLTPLSSKGDRRSSSKPTSPKSSTPKLGLRQIKSFNLRQKDDARTLTNALRKRLERTRS